MGAIRRLLFWLHLICGVTAGVVVLVMSVTGVLRRIAAYAWWPTPALQASAAAGAVRQSSDGCDGRRPHGGSVSRATMVTPGPIRGPAAIALGTRTISFNPLLRRRLRRRYRHDASRVPLECRRVASLPGVER